MQGLDLLVGEILYWKLGGGDGEHAAFVSSGWTTYVCTDVRRPSEEVLRNLHSLGVNFQVEDAQALSFPENKFDRVISTCVLHHLIYPELALLEMRRVVKPGGRISLALPTDPGMTYRFLRRFTTVRNARKFELNSELEIIHAFEHRNHYLGIIPLIQEVFKNDSIRKSSKPFWLFGHHLNAFTVFQIIKT